MQLPPKTSEPGGPAKFTIETCLSFSENVVDFGEQMMGEAIEPRRLTVTDGCGIFPDLVESALDDPDGAFEVVTVDETTMELSMVKETPGAWEAQWVVRADEAFPEIGGAVAIQLFGVVVAPNEE